MNQVIVPIITAIVGAVVGALSMYAISQLNRRRRLAEVLAALRYEIEANVEWLDSVFKSLNYLRDEAWRTVKNEGYILYLDPPIPLMITGVYDRVHALNQRIKIIRELPDDARTNAIADSEQIRCELKQKSALLMVELDKHKLMKR